MNHRKQTLHCPDDAESDVSESHEYTDLKLLNVCSENKFSITKDKQVRAHTYRHADGQRQRGGERER